MSTELGKIKGRHELINRYNDDKCYSDCSLHVTSFYGGDDHTVQLTLESSPDGYIQLNRKQIKKLIRLLLKCL